MHSLTYDNLSTVLHVHNLTYLQSYLSTILPVDMESHPWSNNSPRGVLVLVLRACFPSIASKAWYMKRPTAHSKYTILGAYKRKWDGRISFSLPFYLFAHIYLHALSVTLYHMQCEWKQLLNKKWNFHIKYVEKETEINGQINFYGLWYTCIQNYTYTSTGIFRLLTNFNNIILSINSHTRPVYHQCNLVINSKLCCNNTIWTADEITCKF